MRPFIAEVIQVDPHDPFINGERVVITEIDDVVCRALPLQGMSYTHGWYMNLDQVKRVPSNIGTLTIETLIDLKLALYNDFIS